jgi:glycogen debranching enzyme
MNEDKIVLKHDELFVVCDELGDIEERVLGAGFYFRDMRYLSTLKLRLDGCPLELLDTGTDAIDHLTVYLANSDTLKACDDPDAQDVLPQTIAVVRRRELSGKLSERVTLTNYNTFPVSLRLTTVLAGDFRDIFDIRGFDVDRDEKPDLPQDTGDGYTLSFESDDHNRYATHVTVAQTPDHVEIRAGNAYSNEISQRGTMLPGRDRIVTVHEHLPAPLLILSWDLTIDGGSAQTIHFAVEPTVQPSEEEVELPRHPSRHGGQPTPERWEMNTASIVTSNEEFNIVVGRSSSDLRTLVTPLPNGGRIIAAGIPWYVAPFGRDSLIASRQLLPFNSGIVASTLRYLASVQGTQVDPWRDEEPGKIVHEIRFGEMARSNVVPHSRYYGTVDATPLYVLLMADYLEWTGDDALFNDLRESIDAALGWIDDWGDSNDDGFIDYQRRSERGLQNQGWKDSDNSLQRMDGGPISGPIALVEVQGYVYAAKQGIADAYERGGDPDRAAALRQQATAMRERIEERFWMPDRGYYAEAIDGTGRQIASMSSNQAHLLCCGVPSPERAHSVVKRLFAPDTFSGWGIRTLSSEMPHYNPMSYHNGSVWPHDNGFVLWGLRRYDMREELGILATSLFQAATRFRYNRLPELMCGFPRGAGKRDMPISYPVSCSPQAWAAGVPYVIVETLLGLQASATSGTVTLSPWLPDGVDTVEVCGLQVGQHPLDLIVSGHHDAVNVRVAANPGERTLIVAP